MDNQTILITGGTGSFGKAFVKYLFETYFNIKKVIIFSRDEQKHYAMKKIFSPKKYPISYVLGDVRDEKRLDEVISGVDIIIHAGAMKHVDICEENPFEAIKTNILGSQNVISSAIKHKVSKIVALSTDKSTLAINVYGASKLLLEKLFLSTHQSQSKFTVVRYGNIFGSSGSVIPFFLSKKDKILPITDSQMSRFSMTIQESIDLVIYALFEANANEMIVPKVPSYTILDVAKAIDKEASYPIIGKREGEKLYEIMMTEEESLRSRESEKYYIIGKKNINKKAFEYNSKDNTQWLSIEKIKSLIKTL